MVSTPDRDPAAAVEPMSNEQAEQLAVTYREHYAALNRPRRAPGPAAADLEATVRMETLVAEVRAMCERADAAAAQAAAAAKTAAKRPRPARRPMAWSAAVVLAVLAVCLLIAWLGWLYFTHGGLTW